MTETIQKEVSAASRAKTLRTFCSRRLVFGGLGLGIAIYLGILVVNWPFTETDLVQTLQARSLRTVTIEHFHRTYFPPGCVADGIRFLRIKHPDKPALLTIKKLVVEDNIRRSCFASTAFECEADWSAPGCPRKRATRRA